MPKNRFTPYAGQMKAKERQFEKMQTTGTHPFTGEPMVLWVAVHKSNKAKSHEAFDQESDCDAACEHLNVTTPDLS